MVATTLDPNTPDRGSWYAHSADGGMTWPPLTKVEAARRGWTNIDQIIDVDGIEVVVAHDFGAFALEVNVDAARGAGIWTPTSVGSTVWPRMAVGSPFVFHIVGSIGGNPPTGIAYTRSQDAGASFDIIDMPIFTSPGVSADADGQDIAAQGTNVAIVSANTGGDVGLLTSTDNGDTWAEQVIYDVAGLGELPEGEEEFQPDGSCSVIFDNGGNIHVVWPTFLAIGNPNGDPELYYSVDAPIMHWSAATGITNVAYPNPDTTIGTPVGRNGNYVTQPDIGVNSEGGLFVVYSAMVDDQDTSGNYYAHVFASASTDGGVTWPWGGDMTYGSGFDATFPSLADRVDGKTLHMVYLCDPFPGNFVQNNHTQTQVAVMYLQAYIIIEDVKRAEGDVPAAYALHQNYPNPFNPTTEIQFETPRAGQVTLTVYDILGREVAAVLSNPVTAGVHHVRWDASGMPSGVYFYRLLSGGFSQTKKAVVVK
jgi:hypothetical protein